MGDRGGIIRNDMLFEGDVTGKEWRGKEVEKDTPNRRKEQGNERGERVMRSDMPCEGQRGDKGREGRIIKGNSKVEAAEAGSPGTLLYQCRAAKLAGGVSWVARLPWKFFLDTS